MDNHNGYILNEWNNCLSNYSKIKFNEAKEIYIKLSNCKDNYLKSKLRNDLMLNTLYVVLEFIKNNGFIYLNSSSYDMQDIISTCNEIWINKLDSGILLKVNSFKEIFDSKFYKELTEKLNITKYMIDSVVGINSFIDLLFDYIKLKENNLDFTYNKLIRYMTENEKYKNLAARIYHDNDNTDFCYLFDAIIEAFNLNDNDFNLSKTKLEKLKYIIINNGLECLRRDINKISYQDFTNFIIDKCLREKIIEIIFNDSNLNDMEKDILIKTFGLFNTKIKTIKEIADDYNVTIAYIKKIRDKAFFDLRKPCFVTKLKDFM